MTRLLKRKTGFINTPSHHGKVKRLFAVEPGLPLSLSDGLQNQGFARKVWP